MNIGSEIKMLDVRSFDDYLTDGWKEGFDTSWPEYENDKYYKNTLLNKINYNGSSATDYGMPYTNDKTYSGWKFLYKPFDEEYIQWILLYVFVRPNQNG